LEVRPSFVVRAVFYRTHDSPRVTSALLAFAGFLSLVLVPKLKYPANPPSVGQPETIGYRSELFFLMILISLAALVLTIVIARRLVQLLASYGVWSERGSQ
jgi:hypothetical protein